MLRHLDDSIIVDIEKKESYPWITDPKLKLESIYQVPYHDREGQFYAIGMKVSHETQKKHWEVIYGNIWRNELKIIHYGDDFKR